MLVLVSGPLQHAAKFANTTQWVRCPFIAHAGSQTGK